MITSTCVDLATAHKLIHHVIGRAEQKGIKISVAVVDSGGNLVAQSWMDYAHLAAIDSAIGKAHTALYFQTDTVTLYPLIQSGQPMFGLDNITNYPRRLVVFPGGVLLRWQGVVIGAIGVGGAKSVLDHQIAAEAANLLESKIKE